MRHQTVFSHRIWTAGLILAVIATTLACGFEGGAFGPKPTPAGGSGKAAEPPLSGMTPGVPAASAPAIGGTEPQEGILISAPLPGQGVRGSVQVEGYSHLAPAQQLLVLVRDAQGTVIASSRPLALTAGDASGKFSVAVPLPANVPAQAGRVVVYAVPAGQRTVSHLTSVDVQLNGTAQPSAAPVDPQTIEAITIVLPNPGAQLQGTAKVSAGSLFAPAIVVEVRDANNQVVGRVQQTVDQTNLPAQVTVEVPLQVKQAGPGRLLVYALNPRDGQTEHLNSIDVNLVP